MREIGGSMEPIYETILSDMASAKAGLSFAEALPKMKAAAEAGRDSTKELVAKFGRSARLGERSRGVLDAGATSCCIILCAMADGIQEVVK